MPDITLRTHQIEIIDFNELFHKEIQYSIIESLYELDLLDHSINNINVKRWFLHQIIYSVCEKVLSKNTKSIVYFNNTQLEENELMKYFTEKDQLNFITNVLRRIEKLLPVKFYISKYSIEYLNHLIDTNDGRGQTTVNSMVHKVNSLDITKFTFSKIKTFTKRYELSFLNTDYFNRLSTKLLIIR